MRATWFFFYGTLTEDHDNPLNRAILPLLEGAGEASVRGRLLAVRTPQGCYPALRPSAGRVHGQLYRAGPQFRSTHLRLLDRYELYDPVRPSRSEYRRSVTPVRPARGGTRRAHVYWHIGALHQGLRRIASGNFAAFARRAGLRVFGEAP